jgi:hypothetical protein
MDKAVEVLREEQATLTHRLKAITNALAALTGGSKAQGGSKVQKRHITAAGRKAMQAAGRKRWAKARAAAKTKKAKVAPEAK